MEVRFIEISGDWGRNEVIRSKYIRGILCSHSCSYGTGSNGVCADVFGRCWR